MISFPQSSPAFFTIICYTAEIRFISSLLSLKLCFPHAVLYPYLSIKSIQIKLR
jgi:hypothetical protein